MPLVPGSVLNNRYRVMHLLGQGGFGAVYRVWDLNMDCSRALKENLETSPEAQRQFKREAQILDQLLHPNLPRVIDHFVIEGQGQYLVMDFVEGEDLGELLVRRGRPFQIEEVWPWVQQVCDALSYLHRRNPPVIHRDVKPANIRITSQGKAMLVDFGIAKVYEPNTPTTLGARAATPGYSPIEQYGRGGRTDERSDVYALGATLYTLLTGVVPPEAPERVAGEPLKLPSKLNSAISPAVEAVVLKALALQPQERYPTVEAFRGALQAALAVPRTRSIGWEKTQQAPLPAPKDKSDKKSSGMTWAVLGAVLLSVVVIFLTQVSPPPPPTGASWREQTETALAGATQTGIVLQSTRSRRTEMARMTEVRATELKLYAAQTETAKRSTEQALSRPSSGSSRNPPSNVKPVFVAGDSLNCREGPSKQYQERYILEAGQSVTVLGYWHLDSSWLLVDINDPRTRTDCCWVSSVYGELNVSTSSLKAISILPDRLDCSAVK